MPPWALTSPADLDEETIAALARVNDRLESRKRLSLNHNIPLRLDILARSFHLTTFDIDVILICLAAEIDLRYERLYAYLQDDVTRKRPSVDLILNLLSPSFAAKLEARDRFAAASPLLKHQLIQLSEDSTNLKTSLLNLYLKLDDRILNYLLDRDDIDLRLHRQASFADSTPTLDDLVLPASFLASLNLLFESRTTGRGLTRFISRDHTASASDSPPPPFASRALLN